MTTRRQIITGLAALPISAALPAWALERIDPAFPYVKAEIEAMTAEQRGRVRLLSRWEYPEDRDWWLNLVNDTAPDLARVGISPLGSMADPFDDLDPMTDRPRRA